MQRIDLYDVRANMAKLIMLCYYSNDTLEMAMHICIIRRGIINEMSLAIW